MDSIGGSSAKTDRGVTLKGYGDLSNIFDFGTSTAKADTTAGAGTTSTGTGALGTALNYFKGLLNGGRTSALAAVAPVTNAAQSQADAQKRQLAATGSSRGGGTASVGQQIDDKTTATTDNAVAGARAGAASGVAGVGDALSKIGLDQSGLGLKAADLGNEAAQETTADSIKSRGLSADIHHQAVQSIGNTIESILSFFQ